MTLRNVRNGALAAAVVFFVIGIVMTVTEDHPEESEIEIGHHTHVGDRRPDVPHGHDHLDPRRRRRSCSSSASWPSER